MIKKISASLMSILIIFNLIAAFPVLAEDALPENIKTDYTPGTITGNVLGDKLTATKNWGGNDLKLEGEATATLDVDFGSDSYGYWMLAKRDIPHPYAAWTQVPGTDYYEWDGESLNCYNAISGGNVTANWGDDAGKCGNVVFAFKVNTHVATPVVNFVRANKTLGATNADKVEYSVEYNTVTAGVTPTTQHNDGVWVTNLTGTFADNNVAVDNYNYAIGLAMGTNKDATATVSFDAYMGLEYAYDIKVKADKTSILAGESVIVDADIVNQIGKTGGIAQNVTWYALNKSRTAEASGFTVSQGSDGTANVTTDDTVAEGTYYLVAVADENADFVKSIKIEVADSDFNDYVPGPITGNVLGNKLSASSNFGNNGLKLEGETAATPDADFGPDSYGYYIKALRNIPHPYAKWTKVEGKDYYEWDGESLDCYNAISGGNVTADWGDDAGKCGNVVFAFKVNTYVDTPVVNFVRANNNLGQTHANKVEYSVEYNNVSAGVTPTTQHGDGTVWETNLTGTFKDNDVAVDKYKYSIGFAMGTNKGATATISYDAYMGLEYIYDIKVKSDKEKISAGESFTVDADIVNQVGNTSGFDQGVTWYTLNADRTETVSGFTVTEGGNGTATVKTEDTLNPGKYTLVAVADADKKFVKGISITVADRNYDDYIPGEITGNKAVLYKNGSELLLTSYEPFDVVVSTVNAGTDDAAWQIDTLEDISEGVAAANGRGAAGAYFKKECYSAEELLQAGKNIVIGATVRSTRGTPTIQAAMSQYSLEPTYPIEYPDGLKLENSQWMPFAATFHIPETGWKGYNNTTFNFGFAYTGLVDECKRNVLIKKNSIYIGEEYAYDMSVTSNTKSCALGETTSFAVSANILNQLGSTGYLDQNVTWYALNDERTKQIEGISVVENRNGTATVTIDGGVPAGTYDIVAVSDVYEGLQKGVSINVKSLFEDFVPGEIEGNFLEETDVLGVTWNPPDFTNVGTKDEGTDDEAWTIATSLDISADVLNKNGLGVAGAKINYYAYNAEKNLAAGKKIVIGAKVKKTSYISSPVIKTGMYHLGSAPTFPVEYPNASDGFTVSDRNNWQDFGATIQIPETGWQGYEHTTFYMGFVYTGKSYEGSRGFAVKKNSFYIGEEYAYDIKATSDNTEWKKGQTTSIKLNADIINQVGTEGYLNQNVTWHALDITRTNHVEGIKIIKNADGTATLTVDETVSSGLYDIVAVSEAYEGMVRSIRIKVSGNETLTERVTVFKLSESNGRASLTAAVEDAEATEIFFVIASYDKNNKMIESNVLSVPVVDGIALVKQLSIDKVKDGMKVKGFVWENKTWRPIMFADGVENITIIKETP